MKTIKQLNKEDPCYSLGYLDCKEDVLGLIDEIHKRIETDHNKTITAHQVIEELEIRIKIKT